MVKRLGTCYKDAFNKLRDMLLPEREKWRLCHGVVIGTGPTNKGKPMGHAWLERVDLAIVWDARGGYIPEQFYYIAGKIDPKTVQRWTYEEVLELAVKHKHYGPWNPQIVEAEAWTLEA